VDNVLGYAGKRVIVTGAASGTGAAVVKLLVDLGAEVHALDLHRPAPPGLASFTETDLRDAEQIDEAARKIGSVVDALFNCAHASGGVDALLVNFAGMREITARVAPNMIQGSAVASFVEFARSTPSNAGPMAELVVTPDLDGARAWCEANAARLDDGDALAAQTVGLYITRIAIALAGEGIRINAVKAAPATSAEERAWPLVFLNSPRASAVTGVTLVANGGESARVDSATVAPRR
jgi:hypothetical protein